MLEKQSLYFQSSPFKSSLDQQHTTLRLAQSELVRERPEADDWIVAHIGGRWYMDLLVDRSGIGS